MEWTQIPLSDIERIEVLRGSASEAYGDAALGAVVNVVTRGAAATGRPEGGMSVGSHERVHGWDRASRALGNGWMHVAVTGSASCRLRDGASQCHGVDRRRRGDRVDRDRLGLSSGT